MILIVIWRRIMTVLIIKLTLRIAHFLLLKTLKKLRNGSFEACGIYEKANSRSIPMSNLLPMSNLFPSINGWGVFLLLFSLFTGWSVYIAELLLLLSRHMCLLEVHCADVLVPIPLPNHIQGPFYVMAPPAEVYRGGYISWLVGYNLKILQSHQVT